MLDRKGASGKAVGCILTYVRSFINLQGMPVPCINFLQWTSSHICFSEVPASFPITPSTDFSSSQVKENRNNCACCYAVSHRKGPMRNMSSPMNPTAAIKRIRCWADTACLREWQCQQIKRNIKCLDLHMVWLTLNLSKYFIQRKHLLIILSWLIILCREAARKSK